MNEMREIVTQEQVERLFLILAVAGPAAGLALGALTAYLGRVKGAGLAPQALRGACWGLLGTVNWLLWKLYNALTSVFGLDTVVNLLVNLIVFVALGGAAGWMISRRRNRPQGGSAAPPAATRNTEH